MILAWQFLPAGKSQRSENQLARSETATVDDRLSRERPAVSVTPPALAEDRSSLNLEQNLVKIPLLATTTNREDSPSQFDKLVQATNGELSSLSDQSTSAKDEFPKRQAEPADTAGRALATSPLSAAPVALSESRQSTDRERIAEGAVKEKAASNATQHFASLSASVDAKAFYKQLSQNHQILNSFDAQQNGNELRIIDRDGSVYVGLIQPAVTSLRTRQVAPESSGITRTQISDSLKRRNYQDISPAQTARPLSGVQQYFFRVVGTNETLKQPVSFSGSFLAPTNGSALTASTISGQVSIGQTNQFPVSARRVQK
jgi:hypothetical protein